MRTTCGESGSGVNTNNSSPNSQLTTLNSHISNLTSPISHLQSPISHLQSNFQTPILYLFDNIFLQSLWCLRFSWR